MNDLDRQQWILRCTQRLVDLRPDIEMRHLYHVAHSLWAMHRSTEPEATADHEAAGWLSPHSEMGKL